MLAMLLGAGGMAHAQLEVLPDPTSVEVFGGGTRTLTLRWHNAGDQPEAASLRWRLYQTSSATAAPLMEKAWQPLQVLPGQTVLENAAVEFPAVKARTKFLIQWRADTNRVPGQTEVLVYPTNLLAELKSLLGGDHLGILDPGHALTPGLQAAGIPLLDLSAMTLENYSGRLAIVGPLQSREMHEGLGQRLEQIAKKGVGVIWVQPPAAPDEAIAPSYYVVPAGKGAVVVVRRELVADLAHRPAAQLNLIHFCKLALNPMPPGLPFLTHHQP